MSPSQDESRILDAISGLRGLLEGVPTLKADVANLKTDVQELKKSDRAQNRFMWLATGGLFVLGALVRYGADFLKWLSGRQ